MQRRTIAFLAACAVVLLAVGIWIAFFPNRGADANHKAAGVASVVGTPIPTTGLTKYTIDQSQSSASYSVHENLILGGVGSNTAVGTSNGVQGSFYLGLTGAPTATQINVSVDLTSLHTDSAMRDSHVQDYLDTADYPDAVFISTNVEGLPSSYTPGQTITFKVVGNLKLHGKTNAVTFTMQAKASGNTVSGTGTATIYMTDYGITPPDLANIAIVDNKVTLTINFVAQAS